MSLWHKPASEITFADIDAFCQSMQPEGARLDYKGIAFPKDLAKTIAAFANTMGGLIILGVDADKITNQPLWPPTQGYPTEAGLAERCCSDRSGQHLPARARGGEQRHCERPSRRDGAPRH